MGNRSVGEQKQAAKAAGSYPACGALIARTLGWADPVAIDSREALQRCFVAHPTLRARLPFLDDLRRVEEAFGKLQGVPPIHAHQARAAITVNPDLELLDVAYSGLPSVLTDIAHRPQPQKGFVLVYRRPASDRIEIHDAHPTDLLALKIIADGLDYRLLAAEHGVTLGHIDNIVSTAVTKGILICPPSRIRRPDEFITSAIKDEPFLCSPVFTLQWHITQQCDLSCRHCYDRSHRQAVSLDQGLAVLDDFFDFCRSQFVYGQVTFTGGNPVLHPDFLKLYQGAAERGFLTAILGNPISQEKLESIIAIVKPVFYQVSLEGLREYNDYIRGQGYFERVMQFLPLLQKSAIYAMVMLTLTRENSAQVLELADLLKDKVDQFNFNRLAMVGEGARLASVDVDTYADFLRNYLAAARHNPIMGLKDNLFNLIQLQNGSDHFYSGCAGYGCGAAFNFVSLLPDGRVDACRKFDSPIGNIVESSLLEIYESARARQYRQGPRGCQDCRIRTLCRGCMAVMYGMGKDVFGDPDPYCFAAGSDHR
jgi:selenobiotic family peptide radical SAM maturase